MAYTQNKNFTATSAGFGQMGSVFITGTSAVTSNTLSDFKDAVFCAITFLEDTKFADANGLVAEKQQHFINSDGVQDGISGNTAVTNGEVFPKGVTIYGRWTKITLATGKVIAYIGY
tara:strand:- start:820 stop:1170 length:351 start_codon:yes stop_codon:yes gene_type:complete